MHVETRAGSHSVCVSPQSRAQSTPRAPGFPAHLRVSLSSCCCHVELCAWCCVGTGALTQLHITALPLAQGWAASHRARTLSVPRGLHLCLLETPSYPSVCSWEGFLPLPKCCRQGAPGADLCRSREVSQYCQDETRQSCCCTAHVCSSPKKPLLHALGCVFDPRLCKTQQRAWSALVWARRS